VVQGGRLRAAAVVIVLTVVLAGCGGGSEKKAPNAWAAAVCSQIASWEGRVGSLATDVEAKVQNAVDLAVARTELVAFLDQMVQRTDQLLSAVADVGLPEAERSQEIAAGLRDGLQRVNEGLADARAKAQNLSVASAPEFRQGAEEVAADLAAAGQAVEQELASLGRRYDAPALDAAFDNESDCQQVTTTGDVPAGQWAGEVCGQIVSWREGLQAVLGGLQSEVTGLGRDLTAARARLVQFMAEVVGSTDRLIQATEQAGAPDTVQGDLVAGDLQEGLRQVRQAFEESRVNAENLAVDDAEAFTAGTQRISENIRQAGDRIEQELRDLDAEYDIPALDEAFAGSPACRQVSG
jgi:hypothetical protein